MVGNTCKTLIGFSTGKCTPVSRGWRWSTYVSCALCWTQISTDYGINVQVLGYLSGSHGLGTEGESFPPNLAPHPSSSAYTLRRMLLGSETGS